MFFVKRQQSIKFSETGKAYLDYCELERELNPRSICEYDKILKWIENSLGDIEITHIQATGRHYLGISRDDEAKKAHERGMNMDNWL